MLHGCIKHSRHEKCLIPGSYPITKNNRLDCGRVRNAVARASQQGVLSRIIHNPSLKAAQRRCGIRSKY